MKYEFTPDGCCKRQSIECMDFMLKPYIRRVCVHCFTQWEGPVGAVVKYTAKQWRARLEELHQRDMRECAEWRAKQETLNSEIENAA